MHTRFTIDEEGIEKPKVERIRNGVIVQEVFVHAADLQLQMVKNADEWMLFEAMMDDPETFVSNMFKYVSEYGNGSGREVLQAIVEHLGSETDKPSQEIFREMMALLVEHSYVRSLDYSMYKRLLEEMLDWVGRWSGKNFEAPDELREMFLFFWIKLTYFLLQARI